MSEKQAISQIEATLKRCQQISDNMQASLELLENKLTMCANTMLPIYKETQVFTCTQSNLSQMMVEVDKIISYNEFFLRSEMYLDVKSDVFAYCKWFARLMAAQTYHDRHPAFKGAPKLLARLKEMSKRAVFDMGNVYVELMSQLCATQRTRLDQYFAAAQACGKYAVLNHEHDPVLLRKLIVLARNLDQAGDATYGEVLVNHRSGFLRQQLKTVHDSKFTALESQELTEVHVGRYPKGSHPFIFFLHFFVQLCEAECLLNSSLLSETSIAASNPNWHFQEHLNRLFETSYDYFIKRTESVISKVEKEANGCLIVCDILLTVNTILPRFESVLQANTNNRKLHTLQRQKSSIRGVMARFGDGGSSSSKADNCIAQLLALPDQLEIAVKKQLVAVVAYVRQYKKESKELKLASAEGSVWTHTVETLNYIKKLLAYAPMFNDMVFDETLEGGFTAGASASVGSETSDPSMFAGGPSSSSFGSSFGRNIQSSLQSAELDNSMADANYFVSTSLAELAANRNRNTEAITADILSALEHALDAKARTFKAPAVEEIFLLNNYDYIMTTIGRWDTSNSSSGSSSASSSSSSGAAAGAPAAAASSASSSSVSSTSSASSSSDYSPAFKQSCLQRYASLVSRYREKYKHASWSKSLSFIAMDSSLKQLVNQCSFHEPGEELPKSIKADLKKRLTGFNTAFKNVFETQKDLVVPDADLRAQLRSDNIKLICFVYKSFVDVFGSLQFATHPGKYLKYSVEVLETILNRFFSVEA